MTGYRGHCNGSKWGPQASMGDEISTFLMFFRRNRRVIIEFQGQQHYQYIEKFYRNRAQFESAKERDRRKISYCLAKNIPIYIIPYWEIDNIHSAADLFNQKFLAKNRWKNDKDWQNRKI